MGNRIRFPTECRERILSLRNERGFSQMRIAEVLEMSQRNYSDIENGVHSLSVGDLVRLSDFYGVSVDYLLGRSDSCKKVEVPC